MKKTYKHPELLIVRVQLSSMITSSPNAALDPNSSVDAGLIEVKQNWGSFWDQWAGAAGE